MPSTVRIPSSSCRGLRALADRLLEQQASTSDVVLVVLGAGASYSAGLPLGQYFVSKFVRAFKQLAGEKGGRLLDEESAAVFRCRRFTSLDLFSAAAVLGRFAYGRTVLKETITSELQKATHRPLCYELLAHLAKHRFVSSFITLNFDELFDDALEDELSERLRIITGPDEVPPSVDSPQPKRLSPRRKDKDWCYLVRPFGSLSARRYDITPKEVSEFGPKRIQKLLSVIASNWSSDAKRGKLTLILIGYAAAEAGFEKFLANTIQPEARHVELFVVNPSTPLPPGVAKLSERCVTRHHIALPADTALEIVVGTMKAVRARRHRPWIPVARHQIIANCCRLQDLGGERRFKLELLLQAVKSRGFVQVDAFSQVPRLRRYARDSDVPAVIRFFEDSRGHRTPLLRAQGWSVAAEQTRNFGRLVPSYELADTELIARFIASGTRGRIDECSVRPTGNTVRVSFNRCSALQYVRHRIEEIETAPEIEIVSDSGPDTPWWIGKAEALRSMDALSGATMNVLKRALGPGRIEVLGIWTTGEWLFEGWAKIWGAGLLMKIHAGQGALRCVLMKAAVGGQVRRGHVFGRVEALLTQELKQWRKKHPAAAAPIQFKTRPWWEINRIVTIVRNKRQRVYAAIYMRRRLGMPLVEPFLVKDRTALQAIEQVFERYFAGY